MIFISYEFGYRHGTTNEPNPLASCYSVIPMPLCYIIQATSLNFFPNTAHMGISKPPIKLSSAPTNRKQITTLTGLLWSIPAPLMLGGQKMKQTSIYYQHEIPEISTPANSD
ncbi:hypothetical protein CDAR_576071 [Caerostris darwini]|uniref:Uncharacterized protein n=1 Tax=Caerostris darwini TaxID=1538125 RepID=A0AAV4WYE3_9ARAC|nr:hypothetical protein CDAR_576071 [Caerostris darwini]